MQKVYLAGYVLLHYTGAHGNNVLQSYDWKLSGPEYYPKQLQLYVHTHTDKLNHR